MPEDSFTLIDRGRAKRAALDLQLLRYLGLLPALMALGCMAADGPKPALENPAISLTRNAPDESLRTAASTPMALAFIERSVDHWQAKRKSVTCHTNGLYLVADAQAAPESPFLANSQAFAREYLNRYVTGERAPKGQYGAIEGLVSTASYLAISEMTTARKLDPKTAAALDYAWTRQSASGTWEKCLKCHWGPFEVDNHYGATLATVASAMTPKSYRQRPGPRLAGQRLQRYLSLTLPTSAHQKAMLLWVGRYEPTIATSAQRHRWIADLRSLQQADGGWALIHLGDDRWQREDAKPQYQGSDGYATGMVVFALRQADVSRRDPAIHRGVSWLKSNQRASGRWFTHSPRRAGKHYISQAGTNMALLALASCDELP